VGWGTDYKRIVELEPSNAAAKGKIKELEPLVEQERQKQMQEMIGASCAFVVVRVVGRC